MSSKVALILQLYHLVRLATLGINGKEAEGEVESMALALEMVSKKDELPNIEEVQDSVCSLITISKKSGVYNPESARLIKELLQRDRSTWSFMSNETLAVLGRRLSGPKRAY